ncbi:MAG: carbonate dehydratase [Deltaproteobacteria bacterium HGW-Deltaproteobacteria-19]|nr:MAG: carbonate dehydratase [Deltaproteobacteria bacterium HGW-Deltaproteobacteria-19]
METLLCKHWHHCRSGDVAQFLDTDPERGLSVFEVKHRQEKFGPNTVTVKKRTGPFMRFLKQFHQPLVYILLAAGGTTALLREWVDSSVILGVVLVNAVIGYIQEDKAERAIESLKNLMATSSTVLRDGKHVTVPSAELVPGDVVLLQSGDKVPADLRLHISRELRIDESALTGESVPVEKTEAELPPETILADRKNMAYGGTLVAYGQGRGIVVATGDKTETGRISELVAGAADLSTPLTKKIARFSTILLWAILVLAGLTFGVGLWRGESAVDMFMAAVALAVGAIPEGLPAAVTITLAIGVSRMARKRAIIRKLPAVETLGSTTVICSDKTGTLTENQMTVRRIYAGGEFYSVSGVGYTPEGSFSIAEKDLQAPLPEALAECLRAGLLCNDARLLREDEAWKIQGDPTEGALIVAAAKGGMDVEETVDAFPRLDSIPFESERQYMATLHGGGQEGAGIVYLKGAVEKILTKCERFLDTGGGLQPVDRPAVHRAAEDMAAGGLRVLALARKETTAESGRIGQDDVSSGLTFLGFQGMIDPPRPEALEAVRLCRAAGIEVKMITGDHALTAATIARQIGIGRADGGEGAAPAALTGQDLAHLGDDEMIRAAAEVSVFARVAPEQKLRLVEALQARGQIVAMTGDGVNDAPALKQADIGVAMGITGTDVAKEAADMVLTDDNFASITRAVEEGRRVFDNLVKFIIWTLPTNGGEGLVILAAILTGTTLPILPVQILWINMTTAVLLGLMLAFEPQEKDVMERPPRDPRAPLLDKVMIGRILLVTILMLGAVFSLFLRQKGQGYPIEVARTVAVNQFVMIELFYLFNCRSLTRSAFRIGFFINPWVLVGSAMMVVLQLLFTYTPVMNRLFQTAPVSVRDWGIILLISYGVYLAIGLEKMVRNRKKS